MFMDVLDTCKQSYCFGPPPLHYLRESDAVVFAFDIARRSSWESLPHRRDKALRAVGDRFPLVMVGCKRDLFEQREVSVEEVVAVCEEWDACYVECSAKEMCNVYHVLHVAVLEAEYWQRLERQDNN